MTRVLVVEDDPSISEALRVLLSRNGYDVAVAGSGPAGWQAVVSEQPDALLLDLSLPGLDGSVLLRRLRQSGNEMPVLAVTASSSTSTLVNVLELGADDYIVKPYRGPELVARLRAALRRSQPESGGEAAQSTLECGPFVLDPELRTVYLAGQPLDLSPTERRLLQALLERPNRLLSHVEVVRRVWGSEVHLDPSTLRVNIYRLRRKLDATSVRWGSIRSVPGEGLGIVIAKGEQESAER